MTVPDVNITLDCITCPVWKMFVLRNQNFTFISKKSSSYYLGEVVPSTTDISSFNLVIHNCTIQIQSWGTNYAFKCQVAEGLATLIRPQSYEKYKLVYTSLFSRKGLVKLIHIKFVFTCECKLLQYYYAYNFAKYEEKIILQHWYTCLRLALQIFHWSYLST